MFKWINVRKWWILLDEPLHPYTCLHNRAIGAGCCESANKCFGSRGPAYCMSPCLSLDGMGGAAPAMLRQERCCQKVTFIFWGRYTHPGMLQLQVFWFLFSLSHKFSIQWYFGVWTTSNHLNLRPSSILPVTVAPYIFEVFETFLKLAVFILVGCSYSGKSIFKGKCCLPYNPCNWVMQKLHNTLNAIWSLFTSWEIYWTII